MDGPFRCYVCKSSYKDIHSLLFHHREHHIETLFSAYIRNDDDGTYRATHFKLKLGDVETGDVVSMENNKLTRIGVFAQGRK